MRYQVDRMTPASARSCTAQLHDGKNRAQRGTVDLDKGNMHSMSVSGAERGELVKTDDITLIHNTCLEELVPCSASRAGGVRDNRARGGI